jgi:hypothetical protein
MARAGAPRIASASRRSDAVVTVLAELRLAHAAGAAHYEERDLRAAITADPFE